MSMPLNVKNINDADMAANNTRHEFDGSDVLLNTFFINNKKYRVLIHYNTLIWEKENSKNGKVAVPITDIIAVNIKCSFKKNKNRCIPRPLPQTCSTSNISSSIPSSSLPGAPTSATATPFNFDNNDGKISLVIHYAKRLANSRTDWNRWREIMMLLYNSDKSIIKMWYETLTSKLNQQNRPKRILMFINPYGGRKEALHIYEKYSKPLLQLAGIDVNCVVSQRPNQIRDIIMNQTLSQYDSICCIGGDGTFSEVFNGLIYRTMSDLHLDPLQPEYIPKPSLPIGVIPGGSTDTTAYCLHGTADIKTAVIHIILGQTRGLDIGSVCNSNGMIKLYASVMSYGYLGDVAHDSENFRWLGPKRYDYSGFKKFIANEGYEGEIRLLLDHEDIPDEEDTKCMMNCDRCIQTSKRISESVGDIGKFQNDEKLEYRTMDEQFDHKNITEGRGKWKNVKGKFFMISGANISCACARSPNGFAPYSHLGDGLIDIIVVRHTNLFNNIRLLINLSKRKSDISHLPFVETYRTRKFYFQSTKPTESNMIGSCQPISISSNKISYWNCDGEIIHDSDVLIRSHCQLVKVFMRGPYPKEDTAHCNDFC